MHLDAHMGYNPLHILKIEIQLFEWTDSTIICTYSTFTYNHLYTPKIQICISTPTWGTILCISSKLRYNCLSGPIGPPVFFLGQDFLLGLWFPLWGRSSCWEDIFWGKSFCLVFDFLFGCQSSSWESILIISLLCGASLPVGFLISCLGVILPVGKKFLNESSFWGGFFCWVCDFLFGCPSSCREDILLISLLSGSRLSVGFVISCLGVGLPVGKTFS